MFHKNGSFVISSYVFFDSYELHEIFHRYTGGVVVVNNGINICDSLTKFFADIVITKRLKVITQTSTKQDSF